MPAARYWRLVGIETYAGGDLELSELHLYDASGRADVGVNITSAFSPITGTLANLQDSDTGTTCRFAAGDVRSPAFAVAWDFGAGNTADAIGVRLGSATSEARFIAALTLQYSTDGATWLSYGIFNRYLYPGNSTLADEPVAGDPYYTQVGLLLHGDGPNGGTTITDSSATPKTATTYAGACVGTAQSKFGGASIFAADTAGARVVIDSHEDFNMGDGDFTVECWAYVVASNAGNFEYFVARRITTGYWGFWLSIDSATGCPEFSVCNTALIQFKATSTTAFPLGRWVHLAGVRSGSQIKLFVDGVQAATAAVSGTNFGSNEPVVLFGSSDGDGRFRLNGYVDELRITKGVARYTSDFAPPSAAFASGLGGDEFGTPLLRTSLGGTKLYSSSLTPSGMPTRLFSPHSAYRDFEFGGVGFIAGTVKKDAEPDTPLRRRVRLHREQDGLLVRETWSDATTGAYGFDYIDPTKTYTVVTYDYEHDYRAVIADNITPELIP